MHRINKNRFVGLSRIYNERVITQWQSQLKKGIEWTQQDISIMWIHFVYGAQLSMAEDIPKTIIFFMLRLLYSQTEFIGFRI